MNKQKGLAPVLIILLIALAVGGYLLYQKQIKPVVVPQATPNPVITPVASASAEGANWKTYSNDDFSINYPENWLVKKSDFLDGLQINNQENTIFVIFSKGSYPLFVSSHLSRKENDLKITVGNKIYQVKENIVENENAFVQFNIDLNNNYSVLFGSGPSPVGFGLKNYLTHYQNSKETILQILSTFKFTN